MSELGCLGLLQLHTDEAPPQPCFVGRNLVVRRALLIGWLRPHCAMCGYHMLGSSKAVANELPHDPKLSIAKPRREHAIP